MIIKVKNEVYGKKKNALVIQLSALILAILPILSPYAFLGLISLNMVILGIGLFILILLKGKIYKRVLFPILFLWITHFAISTLSLYTTNYSVSLINSIIMISFNVICIGILWSNSDFKVFSETANVIGIISCFFLFLQATFLAIGLEPPSGKIFNLKLLDDVDFVSSTYGYRLNSLFQEPSYFAIFALPLLVFNLKKGNLWLSLMYTLALVLSSSSLGIIGSLIVLIYYFLVEKRAFKNLILFFILAILVHVLMYNFIDYYSISFNRTIGKIFDITEGRSNIRFGGQIFLFNELPFINQIFGIGIHQMQNYFTTVGIFTHNYSNSFVTIIINTGVLGLISYLLFISYTIYYSYKQNRIIFALIFLMVASIDYLIYNYFFFYLLTFIYINNRTKDV